MKLLCSTGIIWCLQAETTGECGQQSRNQGFMPHWKTPVHSRSQHWTTCKQCPGLASRMHRSFPVGHNTLVSALLATFSSGLCLKAPDNSGAF